MDSVIVTGATGLLGRYLLALAPRHFKVVGVARSSRPPGIALDLLSRQAINEALTLVNPKTLIHAAAEGNVDAALRNPFGTQRINVEVPRLLSEECMKRGIRFVHVSSNAVYGRDPGPYVESSPHSPVNEYGRQKSSAESLVLSAHPDALIVRPILMYGWPAEGMRSNIVVNWIRALKKHEVIRGVSDTWTQPLYAWDCAASIWKAVELGITGSINISGPETMTFYELAQRVAQVFEAPTHLVEAAKSAELDLGADRPRRTEFDLSRMHSELRIWTMPVNAGLVHMRNHQIVDGRL